MRPLALVAWACLAGPAQAQLLPEVFNSSLSLEQREALGPNASLEQMARAMNDEQRQAASARLGQAELTAKTPVQLKEIARGYLILNEKAPNAGQDAVRIANQLIEDNRADPEPHTLAARGYFQQGNFEKSFQKAEDALRRNPRDRAAYTVWMLSKDRRGQIELGGHVTVPGVAEPLSPRAENSDSHKPLKPQQRTGGFREVPTSLTDREEDMSWTTRLDRAAEEKAKELVAKLEANGDLTDAQRETGVRWGKRLGVGVGTFTTAVGGAVGGWLCSPGLVTSLTCGTIGSGVGFLFGTGVGVYVGVRGGVAYQGFTDDKKEILNQ